MGEQRRRLNIGGRIIEVMSDKLSGRALKELLRIPDGRTLLEKKPGGPNRIVVDDDVLNIPENPDDLFLDDIPTLEEG